MPKAFVHCLLGIVAILTPAIQAKTTYKTPDELSTAFNRALTNMDGALLLSTLQVKETSGLKPAHVQQFLNLVMKPVMDGKSLMKDPARGLLAWRDPANKMTIMFQKSGATNFGVVNTRTRLFETPSIKEGSGYKSTVSFGQMMFFAAYHKARLDLSRKTSKAQYAQTMVETWIPKLKSWGFKGTTDPEINQFQTWDVFIKTSRGEIGK